MKIILIQNMRNLGKIGDIVDANRGYIRNHLLNNKIALLANKENVKYFQAKKDLINKMHEDSKKKTAEYIQILQNHPVHFVRQASDDNRLYGAVSKKDITDFLIKLGIQTNITSIHLDKKIKTIGTHKAVIRFYEENLPISISVVRNKNMLNNISNNNSTLNN